MGKQEGPRGCGVCVFLTKGKDEKKGGGGQRDAVGEDALQNEARGSPSGFFARWYCCTNFRATLDILGGEENRHRG
jgi:hypothetical protein